MLTFNNICENVFSNYYIVTSCTNCMKCSVHLAVQIKIKNHYVGQKWVTSRLLRGSVGQVGQ